MCLTLILQYVRASILVSIVVLDLVGRTCN
jgi:hypothetical protein